MLILLVRAGRGGGQIASRVFILISLRYSLTVITFLNKADDDNVGSQYCSLKSWNSYFAGDMNESAYAVYIGHAHGDTFVIAKDRLVSGVLWYVEA